MTPKEKSRQLIDKMYEAQDEYVRCSPDAVRCAIIAVEEILNLPVSFMKDDEDIEAYGKESTYTFWQEVLTELKKMQ